MTPLPSDDPVSADDPLSSNDGLSTDDPLSFDGPLSFCVVFSVLRRRASSGVMSRNDNIPT